MVKIRMSEGGMASGLQPSRLPRRGDPPARSRVTRFRKVQVFENAVMRCPFTCIEAGKKNVEKMRKRAGLGQV